MIKLFFFTTTFVSLVAASAQADPIHSREKLENLAAPIIEDALSKPISELYAAAGKGNATADLTLGLAFLADRRLPNASQSLNDIEDLAALEERVQFAEDSWLVSHKHRTSDEIDWGKLLPLSQSDADMLDRVQMTYSANYWLARGFNAKPGAGAGQLSGTATGYTCVTCGSGVWSAGGFATNFGAKSYTSGPAMALDYKRSDEAVIMTAMHCVEAIREKAALPADAFLFYRLKVGQLPAVSRYNVIARLVYELQDASLKISYPTGASACGEEMQHYLTIRGVEPLETSALRTRFKISN